MEGNNIEKIVIVGGGTAGWMAAASAAVMLRNKFCKIYLVESPDIGTVGVGEATIPPILDFNRVLGLNENEFMAKTQGTFKAGIKFINWGSLNHQYFHPFGKYGTKFDAVHFHHYWLRSQKLGITNDLDEYSILGLAARKGRFARPDTNLQSLFSDFGYAFHFDAALYAKFLRERAEANGVIRLERKVADVKLKPDNGFIESIVFDSGEELAADFFIDCSGFRGVLIEQGLKTGYVDWSHYLPCNRAVAVPSANVGEPAPYTQSTAHHAGWQWKIPLRHRTGNGHVFCNDYCSEDEATAILLKNLEGEALAEPRVIPFKSGMRKKGWNKNCLSVGLASGFMEPLESTSIHLIQSSLAKFFRLFPDKNCDDVIVDEFNRQSKIEIERIRDFIILHYYATTRTDSPFWKYCQNMDIPETLQRKIALYKNSGRIFREDEELFQETSWFAVLQGQGIYPEAYDSLADVVSEADLKNNMQRLRTLLSQGVEQMPSHLEYINKYCKYP